MTGEKAPIYTQYRYDRLAVNPEPFAGIFPHPPRVAIVDDLEGIVYSEGLVLARAGITPIGILVNGENRYTDLEHRHLVRTICELGVDAAIIDKGLGYVNGIWVTRKVTESDIPTLMFTGEPDTRETHRVGTRYLEKNRDYDNVETILILYILMGLGNDQVVDIFKKARRDNPHLLPRPGELWINQYGKNWEIIGCRTEPYEPKRIEEINKYNKCLLAFRPNNDFSALTLPA